MRFLQDASAHALIEAGRGHRCQQRPSRLLIQPGQPQIRQTRQRILRRRRRPGGKDQPHRLGQQPPPHEAEHLSGGLIQPLHVIDDAQQRTLLGGLCQQVQRRQRHQKRFRGLPGRQTQCHTQRLTLGFDQRVQAREHRRAKVVQPSEGQLHLRLDAHAPRHPEARRPLGHVPQQRRLADPRLPAQHQHGAAPTTHPIQQPVQRRALASPPIQRRQRVRVAMAIAHQQPPSSPGQAPNTADLMRQHYSVSAGGSHATSRAAATPDAVAARLVGDKRLPFILNSVAPQRFQPGMHPQTGSVQVWDDVVLRHDGE